MPIVDNLNIAEYPYRGTFYQEGERGGGASSTGSLFEGVRVDVVVLETECDIQRVSFAGPGSDGLMTGVWKVYFPLGRGEDILIRKGMRFSGEARGMSVEGVVRGVRPSEVGGCSCEIMSDGDGYV